MKRQSFAGKVAIVTGASTGIGRELALQLAGQGASVTIAARNEKKLREVAELCASRGGQVLMLPTDVGDKEACKRLVEATVSKFDRIDALFNNAGYGLTSDLLELQDLALFEDVMRINFHGSMYCTYYALPYLVQSKGYICAVSSIAGIFSMGGSSIYNASKFAMRGFFDALRMELHDKGVSVTLIYPGYVVTDFSARVQDGTGKERGRGALKIYKKGVLSAEKCAEIILRATSRRKRAVLMTIHAKIGFFIKILFPRFFDWIVRKYRDHRNREFNRILKE